MLSNFGVIKMKGRKIAAVASYIAAVCFFIAYLFRRNTVLMLLGAAWMCIGAANMIWTNKKK